MLAWIKQRAQQCFSMWHRSERASISVEFALALPLFTMIAISLIEAGNFLQLHLKVYHTSVSIADLTTRDEEISEGDVTDIFSAATHVMAPYEIGSKSKIILSNIHKMSGQEATILWQRAGAGQKVADSQYGIEGDTILSIPNMTLIDNESIIIAEIFYKYEPMFFPEIAEHTIYKATYYRPRIGALVTIEP